VPTAGIDFFRVDRSTATKRLLVTAAVLVAVGMTAIGAHLVRRIPADLGHLVTLLGGLTLIVGLITGFGAMGMLLFENVYLLIGEDGVLCHENGKETTIAWPDLESITVDEGAGVLVLARRGGAAVRWFAGRPARDIHDRIEEARRKALHGLLKEP
jgi:hypothetical protein